MLISPWLSSEIKFSGPGPRFLSRTALSCSRRHHHLPPPPPPPPNHHPPHLHHHHPHHHHHDSCFAMSTIVVVPGFRTWSARHGDKSTVGCGNAQCILASVDASSLICDCIGRGCLTGSETEEVDSGDDIVGTGTQLL